MTTTSSEISSTPPAPSLVTYNVSPQLPLKLTTSNYMLWRAQFIPLLCDHDLLGYVTGSFPKPSSTSDDNPTAAALWERQDQLILSWIVSSLSDNTLSHIVSTETSHKAWTLLARTFAPSSRTRVLDLKDRLSRLQKGSDSVADYLLSVHTTADTLAAIDRQVNDEDLVLAVLRGLGADYRDFATSIRIRAEPISMIDLTSLLLSHKTYLASISDAPSVAINTANLASRDFQSLLKCDFLIDYALYSFIRYIIYVL